MVAPLIKDSPIIVTGLSSNHQYTKMTAPQLIKTKIHIPVSRVELVTRLHLTERLKAGLSGKLTLVSAPAGFGKTTLISRWINECELPSAWISLDRGDNDLELFVTYLIKALQSLPIEYGPIKTLGQEILNSIKDPQPQRCEVVLTALINEISDIPEKFILVLDDYHEIDDPIVHKSTNFILENQPHNMHLVISSRADPPWPLARLRVRRELNELRAQDLRFTVEESSAFLKDVMGLNLTGDEVNILDERIEGWVAGLQLAALSMRGQENLITVIQSFTSNNRFVLDYLVEEVLCRQPPEIQHFMLVTSVVQRMTASLCNAITGRQNSQEILHYLDEANLFLVPLDDIRGWFRYQNMFADLLRSNLENRYADLLPGLHEKASIWFEKNGLPAEAIEHALAANDVERVANMAEQNAVAMLDHGELSKLSRWLEALPEQIMYSRPWLCVAYAWVLAYTGELDSVLPLLKIAEEKLAEPGYQESTVQRITGHIEAIEAYSLWVKGECELAIKRAVNALEKIPPTDIAVRSISLTTLGLAYQVAGELEAAKQELTRSIELCQQIGGTHASMLAVSGLSYIYTLQNKLKIAASLCKQALGLTDPTIPLKLHNAASGSVYATLSIALIEWNDLQTAIRYTQEGLHLSQQWGQADAVTMNYIFLAFAYLYSGATEAAFETIHMARQYAQGVSIWFRRITLADEIKIHLLMGDVETATRLAEETKLFDELPEPNFDLIDCYNTRAYLYIEQGHPEKALDILKDLLPIAMESRAFRMVIKILILQALAYQANEQPEQALSVLHRALALAEPEEYITSFTTYGLPMRKLLCDAALQGIAVAYVNKLLLASGDFTPPASDICQDTNQFMPFEPLSSRELEVLKLLNSKLSNPEIAKKLYVANSTLRTHVKSIYKKLNVHRRVEAIQRGKDLGML